MQLFLMPNLSKEGVHTCVNRLTAMRFGEPVTFLMDERLKGEFPGCGGVEWGPYESLIARCDACIAIGGDGTIIHSGKSAACRHKPVLGINLGRLGFLATLESDQLEKLEGLLTGDYTVEERMLLQVTLCSPDGTRQWLAMNDAVLSKGGPLTQIIELDVRCGGQPVGTYRADGLIFSTPTGSTAYAMSAGGPIVDPAMQCICLTPLSSHSLFSRPILFDASGVLTACPAPGSTGKGIYLTIDGEETVPVGPGETVRFERSEIPVKLINLTGKSFTDVLNEKLIWRSRK